MRFWVFRLVFFHPQDSLSGRGAFLLQFLRHVATHLDQWVEWVHAKCIKQSKGAKNKNTKSEHAKRVDVTDVTDVTMRWEYRAHGHDPVDAAATSLTKCSECFRGVDWEGHQSQVTAIVVPTFSTFLPWSHQQLCCHTLCQLCSLLHAILERILSWPVPAWQSVKRLPPFFEFGLFQRTSKHLCSSTVTCHLDGFCSIKPKQSEVIKTYLLRSLLGVVCLCMISHAWACPSSQETHPVLKLEVKLTLQSTLARDIPSAIPCFQQDFHWLIIVTYSSVTLHNASNNLFASSNKDLPHLDLCRKLIRTDSDWSQWFSRWRSCADVRTSARGIGSWGCAACQSGTLPCLEGTLVPLWPR